MLGFTLAGRLGIDPRSFPMGTLVPQAMLRSARIPCQPVHCTANHPATAHGRVTFGKSQLPCSYGSCRSRPGGQSRRRAVTSPERPSPILRTGVRLAPFAPATPVFGRVRHNGQVPWFAHLTTSICRRQPHTVSNSTRGACAPPMRLNHFVQCRCGSRTSYTAERVRTLGI